MLSERVFRPLFLLATAFTLFMALLPKPPALPIDRFGDKFEHMLAFGVLTMLARFSFRRVPWWQLLEHMSFFGALIEVCQAIPRLHRDCDPRDWVADTVAISLALVLAYFLAPTLGRGEATGQHG